MNSLGFFKTTEELYDGNLNTWSCRVLYQYLPILIFLSVSQTITSNIYNQSTTAVPSVSEYVSAIHAISLSPEPISGAGTSTPGPEK